MTRTLWKNVVANSVSRAGTGSIDWVITSLNLLPVRSASNEVCRQVQLLSCCEIWKSARLGLGTVV